MRMLETRYSKTSPLKYIIELTKEEAAKYDAIIHNELAATMEDKDRDDVGISSFWDLVRRDLDWFRKNNAKAYMVLLD